MSTNAVSASAPRTLNTQRFLEGVAIHSVAITISLLFLLPFVFAFLTAVMTDDQALTSDLWPRTWRMCLGRPGSLFGSAIL
jgi:multiple sugar transport system permease protein